MNRRGFLQTTMLATVSAGMPRWLNARPAAPWLVGFETVGVEAIAPVKAQLEGRWPTELSGTLYRNGPAWFDRGGVRYQHWFDGDGMLRAWHIRDGAVTHLARMVATEKFVHEQRVGRFEVRAAGTRIANPIAGRNNDSVNTANTAVMRIGGRVFALWEGGSAVEVDPQTLETRGLMTWREDLAAAPFSAHPLQEADGSTWNFGSLSFFGGNGLLIWRIGADGRLIGTQMLESTQPGYLHAFAMTPNYLVFMLMPFRMDRNADAFFEGLRFATDQPCRIALVPKQALDQPRWFEADFAAVYHFGDAYEDRDRVIMRAVRHADAEEARSPMAAAMRGERGDRSHGTNLANLHLDLASGRAHWEALGVQGIEFPTFDARTPAGHAAVLFAPSAVRAAAPYFDAVSRIDARGRVVTHRYGPRILAEEHRFVPRMRGNAGEGWLLGTLLDYDKGRSGLAVLDASRVSDGPLAIAWVPFTTPLGFHGWFDAATA